MKIKGIIGYTTGVFDLFHIGHLNILKKAKEHCDYLIVGVTIDELVKYKFKKAVIPFEERAKIVESIKYVDEVVPQTEIDKLKAWNEYHFNKIFVGSDWKGSKSWIQYEQRFKKLEVEVIYFPYTKGTSSSKLNEVLDKIRHEKY
tara:strand:- start:6962 stop:7396 length:435 start_codon:yes stop_codon:yes gene_type:complete